MEKFKPCKNCMGKNGKVAPEGYISKWVDGVNNSKIEVLTECDCHKKWRENGIIEAKAKKSNLNPKWVNYTIEDYVGTKSLDSVKRVKSYLDKLFNKDTPVSVKDSILSTSLYLYGRNGTQKTTMANYIGYTFLRNGKTVYYCLMNDLIKMLQKADRDEDIQATLDKISNVDILIIDESFDMKKVTIYKSGFQIPFLDTFLRNRLQTKNKGIIFISNMDIHSIKDNGFNVSIEDLVIRSVPQYCVLEFDDNWKDESSSINTEELF